MKYFAYGSNMSVPRLTQRLPSTKFIGAYQLSGFLLKFHKASCDGSGKCDAFETNEQSDFIIGVLFDIDENEKPILDKIEGVGQGYEEKTVIVENNEGEKQAAYLYIATDINQNLAPYDWYKNHVLTGAKNAKLPLDYIEKIAAVKAKPDQNTERSTKEYRVYKAQK